MDRQTYLKLIEPAVALVARKGEDYNANTIQLAEYFPFKDKSYQQMLHMKVLRMRSLLDKGSAPNFDSMLDSVYDLLNYAVFYLEYLESLPKEPTILQSQEMARAIAAQNVGMTSGLNKPYRAPHEQV